jgi:hypothetical protein
LKGIACWPVLGSQAREKPQLFVKEISRMQHKISVDVLIEYITDLGNTKLIKCPRRILLPLSAMSQSVQNRSATSIDDITAASVA